MAFTPEQKRQRRAEKAEREGRQAGKAGRPACPACTGTGPLHGCEDFPLPVWAGEYLSTFDRAVRTLPLPAGLSDPDPFLTPADDHRPVTVTVCLPVLAPAHGKVRPAQVRAVMPLGDALTPMYAGRDWDADPVSGTLPPVSPVRHLSGPVTVRKIKPAAPGTFPGQADRQRRRNERRKEAAMQAHLSNVTRTLEDSLTEAATLPPIPFDLRDAQDWIAAR